jgi:hypothetical protein
MKSNAFPMMPSHTNPQDVDQQFVGLSKLELISAMAMQGMLANSYSNGVNQPLSEASRHEMAELAVDQAKALLNRVKQVT